MRPLIDRRWSFMVLMLIAAFWTKASVIPDNLPNQVVNVINHMPDDRFQFKYNIESSSTYTFISVCSIETGQYGVAPFNTTESLCWVYDEQTGQLTYSGQYERMFETDVKLNNSIPVFLAHQPDPNKGVWVGQPKSACYHSSGSEQNRNYCLKSESSETATEEPADTENEKGKRWSEYTLVSLIGIGLMGLAGYLEYRYGCIRSYCEM